MKISAFIALTLVSVNAFAIEFISEEQVQDTINADKVIEIGRGPAEKLIEEGNEKCASALLSRSARAYAVKKGNESFVYVTASGLRSLQNCGSLY